MAYSREFFITAGKNLGAVQIAPIVEAWVWADGNKGLCSFVGGARPLGFAILTAERGYWLVGPATVEELARAVFPAVAEARVS